MMGLLRKTTERVVTLEAELNSTKKRLATLETKQDMKSNDLSSHEPTPPATITPIRNSSQSALSTTPQNPPSISFSALSNSPAPPPYGLMSPTSFIGSGINSLVEILLNSSD